MVQRHRFRRLPSGWLRPTFPREAPAPWLNLGCGRDYRDPNVWVNADLNPTGELRTDADFDFRKTPWPFDDGTFGLVYMSHVIEHVPHVVEGQAKDGFFVLMEELHRVLRPGGYVVMQTPHWESEGVLVDPTHTRAVHPENFRYLEPEHTHRFYTTARFHLVEAYRSGYRVWFRWPRFGPSGLSATEHLWERAPFLRPLLRRHPVEMTYVLRKVPAEAAARKTA